MNTISKYKILHRESPIGSSQKEHGRRGWFWHEDHISREFYHYMHHNILFGWNTAEEYNQIIPTFRWNAHGNIHCTHNAHNMIWGFFHEPNQSNIPYITKYSWQEPLPRWPMRSSDSIAGDSLIGLEEVAPTSARILYNWYTIEKINEEDQVHLPS